MMQSRQKFLFIIGRFQKGKNTYGTCKNCITKLKKGDVCASNRGNRYCQECYERLFKEKIEIE